MVMAGEREFVATYAALAVVASAAAKNTSKPTDTLMRRKLPFVIIPLSLSLASVIACESKTPADPEEAAKQAMERAKASGASDKEVQKAAMQAAQEAMKKQAAAAAEQTEPPSLVIEPGFRAQEGATKHDISGNITWAGEIPPGTPMQWNIRRIEPPLSTSINPGQLGAYTTKAKSAKFTLKDMPQGDYTLEVKFDADGDGKVGSAGDFVAVYPADGQEAVKLASEPIAGLKLTAAPKE